MDYVKHADDVLLRREMKALKLGERLDYYIFDKIFFEEIGLEDLDQSFDGGSIVIFRLINKHSSGNSNDWAGQQKFLHLFNIQNGFYSHGFIFSDDGKIMIAKKI